MDTQIREMTNLLTKEECEDFIDQFEKDPNKYRSTNEQQADGGTDYRQAHLLHIDKLPAWKDKCEIVNEAVDTLVHDYLTFFKTGAPLVATGYTIAKYNPGDCCIEHKDNSYANPEQYVLSMVIFLNDVAEGGELVFPIQGDSIKPEQGKGVIYPSMFTHRHKVERVVSNPRYALIVFVKYARKSPPMIRR